MGSCPVGREGPELPCSAFVDPGKRLRVRGGRQRCADALEGRGDFHIIMFLYWLQPFVHMPSLQSGGVSVPHAVGDDPALVAVTIDAKTIGSTVEYTGPKTRRRFSIEICGSEIRTSIE